MFLVFLTSNISIDNGPITTIFTYYHADTHFSWKTLIFTNSENLWHTLKLSLFFNFNFNPYF